MPYARNIDLPENIKNVLPQSAQTIWRKVFNSSHGDGDSETSSRKQAWAAVKNAGYEKDEDTGKWKKVKKVFKASCEVTGVNESLGIVFGWGMVTKVNGEDYYDLDKQHVTNQFMLKATSSFMEKSRVSNDMHTDSDIGTVVHSFPLTEEVAKSMGIFSNINGWMVGVKPDENTLAKFVSGEYTGFSIEGSAEWIDVED